MVSRLPIDRILVPTGLDPRSRFAFRRALQLAASSEATVELLHVVSPAAGVMSAHLGRDMRASKQLARHQEKLETWAREEPHDPELVECRVEEGDILRRVLAASLRADLLVMCTAGQDDLGDWLHGTKTQRMLDRAQAELWVVRPPADEDLDDY